VQEQVYATAVVRRFSPLVAGLWLVTSLIALTSPHPAGPLLVHAVGFVFIVVVARALHDERTERSPARLRNLFILLGSGANALLSLAALMTGGLTSL
jgi:uncharacterized membrane protein YecN with MAPEG domain